MILNRYEFIKIIDVCMCVCVYWPERFRLLVYLRRINQIDVPFHSFDRKSRGGMVRQ